MTLARAPFFVGVSQKVSAPGAFPWETTGRAPRKAEHDKSSGDNLCHCRMTPDLSWMSTQPELILGGTKTAHASPNFAFGSNV
jgi:hypothetical protein